MNHHQTQKLLIFKSVPPSMLLLMVVTSVFLSQVLVFASIHFDPIEYSEN